MYDGYTQLYAHTYEQFLQLTVCLGLVFVCLLPSVLQHCWLGVRKSIWPVKSGWGVDVVFCLHRGANDLHIVQLMTLPPHQVWKTAHVTPVPKTSPVTGYGDLRPISVTSILSRTVEKLVVKNYLTSVLHCPLFHDQYTYKPTGCIICATVDWLYLSHTYVVWI